MLDHLHLSITTYYYLLGWQKKQQQQQQQQQHFNRQKHKPFGTLVPRHIQ